MRDPCVFISHASKEKELARRICEGLEARGLPCWIALRDAKPGRDYRESIVAAIRDCPVLVLVFTRASNSSRNVGNEIEHAKNSDATIIQLRIEDVPLSPGLSLDLSSLHWIDAQSTPIDSHLDRLAEAVVSALRDRSIKRWGPQELQATEAAPERFAGLRRSLLRRSRWAPLGLLLLLAAGGWLILQRLGGDDSGELRIADLLQGGRSRQAARFSAQAPSSSLPLESGAVMLRTEGISQRFESAVPEGVDSLRESAPGRLTLVTNQPDSIAALPGDLETTVLKFQVNNNSEETVLVGEIRIVLIGAVHIYEDVIPEPIPPKLRRPIPDLVLEDRPFSALSHASLDTIFEDEDTPPDHLAFDVVSNTAPQLIRASIDGERNLVLAHPGTGAGETEITVQAEDPFGLTARGSFAVEIIDRHARLPSYASLVDPASSIKLA
ncbi:MAG: TIR domain-containing protein, partial [Candidatus Eisenbacteria bacterium]|nr:TIR domain-containing protein [Candidatus Latescibacterota bacterium]MBD3301959.1 TIR domain-containing protein [Candidatus Eisenbacteria bacterium]